jgi:hypothetical protein
MICDIHPRGRPRLVLGGRYDLHDVAVDEILAKKILIRQHLIETDIHPFVEGVSFDEAWARRIDDRIGDTPVPFASLDDLIRMKEAAGRPKDLEDLRVLRALRDKKR